MTTVTPTDLMAALDEVPEAARRIAERRAAIEEQHRTVEELRGRARRVSVDGLAFDLGDGWYVHLVSSGPVPTPKDSPVLYYMTTLPCTQWDVDDYHGGWA